MLGFFDHLDKNGKARAAVVGSAILVCIEIGLQVSGLTNLLLAITLWGIAALLFFYWLSHFKLFIRVRAWARKQASKPLVRYGSIIVVGCLLFLGGIGFQNWLSPFISTTGTKVELGPRKRAAIPAAPIPTSLRILFGPASVAPKELQSKNVEWQAIEGTASAPKYANALISMSPSQQALACTFNPYTDPDACFVRYKTLELVLSFEKPVTFKKIKIEAIQGGEVPRWKQVILTETDAVLRFDSYPADKLLDIEVTDEDAK